MGIRRFLKVRKEKLKTIECIRLKNFKHKMKLTKKKDKNCKMQVIDNYLYIERWRYE